MLAGIAGSTIEEARERMPVEEVGIWQAWMAKNGPLSLQRRIEGTSAQVAMILANANRDPKRPAMKLTEFLLYSQRETEEVDDLHQAFGELFKVAGPTTRDGGGVKRKLWRRRPPKER